MSKSEKPDIKRDLETSRGILHFTVYKLLEETKKRPLLWNKKDPNYKKRECIDKAWNDVTRTFIPFFDELDDDEQFNLSEVLRKRYHSCVSQLNISIKNRSDPKYRPFMYAKQMEFYLKMRGYKLEDLYDEKEIEAIVKKEKPIETEHKEEKKEDDDDSQIDEIELMLRKELGEDDEEDDPINENEVSSSKKAKTTELSPTARSSRLRQKQYILQTSRKEPNPTSTTPKTKVQKRKSLQIKKCNSPNVEFLGYDEMINQINEDEEEEDEEEEEVELVEYHEVEDKMDYIEEDHEIEEEPQDVFRQQQKQQKPKTSKTKINSNSTALPMASSINTFENESDFADQAFFESIKPAVRKMNEAQKLDFKIDVLQVLRTFQTN